MQGLLCKFHIYLEKINFHYVLKMIPGNLSLAHFPSPFSVTFILLFPLLLDVKLC